MFHNYFFLKRLAQKLHQELVNTTLLACYSQHKDELILGFASTAKEFYIRANLDANISLLSFPDDFRRANRNSVDLFKDLIGKQVQSVLPFAYERSFQIQFENEQTLVFNLYNRRSNILHFFNGNYVAQFRKQLGNSEELKLNDFNKNIDINWENFAQNEYDPLQLIPALGKPIRMVLEENDYYSLNQTQRWEVFQNMLQNLYSNPIYLHKDTHSIHLLKKSEEFTDNPIAAANWIYQQRAVGHYFDKEKQQAISQLKQQIKKSENYLTKTTQKLTQLQNSRNPEELANLLMANLHQINKGASKVVLMDFYTNKQIEIKLNEKLNPQKNAENYYRKSKNRNIEIAQLEENIQAKSELIEQLSMQILELKDITDFKVLRKYIKNKTPEKNTKQHQKLLPYHLYEIDGWQVLIGRNAKANDELTLKIAKKNDLWLHAKDVAGSHVVIKERSGYNFPKNIIQLAAEYAAYNSKRKTDSLCPVIFTPKKYVRKLKGAPAGQVIVEKEEVLMVVPKAPE